MTIPMVQFNPPPRRESLLERLLAIGAASALTGAVNEKFESRAEKRRAAEWDRQTDVQQGNILYNMGIADMLGEQRAVRGEQREEDRRFAADYTAVTRDQLLGMAQSGVPFTPVSRNGQMYIPNAQWQMAQEATGGQTATAQTLSKMTGLPDPTAVAGDTLFSQRDYADFMGAMGSYGEAVRGKATDQAVKDQAEPWENVYYRGVDDARFLIGGFSRLRGPNGPLTPEEIYAYNALPAAKLAAQQGYPKAKQFVEQWGWMDTGLTKSQYLEQADITKGMEGVAAGYGTRDDAKVLGIARSLQQMGLYLPGPDGRLLVEPGTISGNLDGYRELVEAWQYFTFFDTPTEAMANNNGLTAVPPSSPLVKGWLQRLFYHRRKSLMGEAQPDPSTWYIEGAVDPLASTKGMDPLPTVVPGRVSATGRPYVPTSGVSSESPQAGSGMVNVPPQLVQGGFNTQANPASGALVRTFAQYYINHPDGFTADTSVVNPLLRMDSRIAVSENPDDIELATTTLDEMMMFLESKGAGPSEDFQILKELSSRAGTDSRARNQAWALSKSITRNVLDVLGQAWEMAQRSISQQQ